MIDDTNIKRIPGLKGFAASKDGQIWTENKWRGWGSNRLIYQSGEWRVVPTKPCKKRGYRIIVVSPQISGTGKTKMFYVHSLVLLTFVGPCPEGLECRHINGIASDCSLTNLVWGTHLENIADKKRHGTYIRGERSKLSSLTEEKVKEIKEMIQDGVPNIIIAKITGTSTQNISNIKKNKRWKHVI